MINLLLCGNKKVFDGALCELISITKRTEEPITCFIFTADVSRIKEEYVPISEDEVKFLDEYVKSKNPKNKVIRKDVTDLYIQEFMDSPNESAYCTPYTLLRLLADKVEDIPDKLLYLDIDMMIANDLNKLFSIDISDYEYAAVKEKYGCWLIRPDYINAGMLFADQDALFWSTTKKKIIPRKFNEQSSFDRKDTVVCHFSKRLLLFPYPRTENYKQWNIPEVHSVLKCFTFDEDLDEYVKLIKEFRG